MILKDLLNKPYPRIMARTNVPPHWEEEDTLFGYCAWDGENLVSLDGDNYSLNDVVEKYEITDDMLIYWFKTEWEMQGE